MNAAYNPGLTPLGSALAFMKMRHESPGSSHPVERCVLVEVPRQQAN